MIADLKVDYESIESSTIPKMQKIEEDVQALYTAMDRVIKSLKQYMEAEAADAYLAEFEELVGPDIQKIEELVAEYYTQLSQVVKQFADMDSEISKMIMV